MRRILGCMLCLVAGHAHAQLTGNPGGAEPDLWRVVLGTGLVAVLAVVALLWLRRRSSFGLGRGAAAHPGLQVVSRTAFDAHNALAIVSTGTQRWLVGVGPQGPRLLAELRDASPATPSPPADGVTR